MNDHLKVAIKSIFEDQISKLEQLKSIDFTLEFQLKLRENLYNLLVEIDKYILDYWNIKVTFPIGMSINLDNTYKRTITFQISNNWQTYTKLLKQ